MQNASRFDLETRLWGLVIILVILCFKNGSFCFSHLSSLLSSSLFSLLEMPGPNPLLCGSYSLILFGDLSPLKDETAESLPLLVFNSPPFKHLN